MSSITEDQIKEIFDTFDVDGNGSVDKSEIKEICRLLKIDTDEQEIDELIIQLDKDGNGKIEFKEFKTAVLASESWTK